MFENFVDHFNARRYNLIVGGILTIVSLLGTLLMKCLRLFGYLPNPVAITFWTYVLLFAAAIVVAYKVRYSLIVQVVAYMVVAIPAGVVIEVFVEVNNIESAALIRSDEIYRAGIICTTAFLAMTALSWLLPKLLRLNSIKAVAVFATIAYVIGVLVAVAIVNDGILGIWSIAFSFVPYATMVLSWHYQTGGTITFESACSAPIRTFILPVELAQSDSDE